jgi:NAD(P)H-nitrite reductase large subunit
VLLRVSPGAEFVQVVVAGGRVVGALLLGDTDLEETMENLILNKLDVRGPDGNAMDLLDPEVDLEGYFD